MEDDTTKTASVQQDTPDNSQQQSATQPDTTAAQQDNSQQQAQNAEPQATTEPSSLLGDNADSGADNDSQQQPQDTTPQDEKTVEEFVNALAITELDVGGGRKFDKAAAGIVAPQLMKLGLDAEKGRGVVEVFSAYQAAQAKAAETERLNVLNQMVDATKEHFGNDLPRVIDEAKRGGAAIFGAEVWKELSGIPEFANNSAIIDALAAHGRKITDDTGTGGTASGGGSGNKGFAEAWIESSNRRS